MTPLETDRLPRDLDLLPDSTHIRLPLACGAELFVSSPLSSLRLTDPRSTIDRFPTAGGQYQWCAECAPPSLRRLLTYCTGWLCTLAWTTFVAGCGIIIGNLIKYCIVLYYPDSVAYNSQWFPTLLAVGAVIIAALFNIFLATKFPLLEGIVLVGTTRTTMTRVDPQRSLTIMIVVSSSSTWLAGPQSS